MFNFLQGILFDPEWKSADLVDFEKHFLSCKREEQLRIIQALVNVLQSEAVGMTEPFEIKEYAVNVLRCLASLTYPSFKDRIVKREGIKAVVALLKSPDVTVRATEAAAAVLQIISHSHDESYQIKIGESGGFAALVAVLRSETATPCAKEYAVGALNCAIPVYQNDFGHLQEIPVLVDLLRSKEATPCAKEYASYLLVNGISFLDKRAHKLVIASDKIAALVVVLQNEPVAVPAQNAVRLLIKFAADPAHGVEMISCGARKALIKFCLNCRCLWEVQLQRREIDTLKNCTIAFLKEEGLDDTSVRETLKSQIQNISSDPSLISAILAHDESFLAQVSQLLGLTAEKNSGGNLGISESLISASSAPVGPGLEVVPVPLIPASSTSAASAVAVVECPPSVQSPHTAPLPLIPASSTLAGSEIEMVERRPPDQSPGTTAPFHLALASSALVGPGLEMVPLSSTSAL